MISEDSCALRLGVSHSDLDPMQKYMSATIDSVSQRKSPGESKLTQKSAYPRRNAGIRYDTGERTTNGEKRLVFLCHQGKRKLVD